MPKCKPMNEAYAAEQAQKWRKFYDANAALFKAGLKLIRPVFYRWRRSLERGWMGMRIFQPAMQG